VAEPSANDVSVIIPTHNRCSQCRLAVSSALSQEPQPREVLVCDDGSTDATASLFGEWAEREPRLRYLRRAVSAGGPGPARNLGIQAATGSWIALLDDDDEWLPGKLAAQIDVVARAGWDVVGTNALRTSNDRPYFESPHADLELSRLDLLRDNPLILSTVLLRRALVDAVGGFATQRWLGGIEDYRMWLDVADRGARIGRLAAPLVRYTDGDSTRMSDNVAQLQMATIRLFWTRWLRRPTDPDDFRAAVNQTHKAWHIWRATRRT
jgi:glycosyltransferase involved in cell wall biosynthesis